jgi:hypothetical protein
MLHIIKDELSTCLAADRRVAGREEFERHRSERTAAGRKARFHWVWAQRISPKCSMVSSEHGEDRDDHQHLMQPTWAPGFDQSRPAGSRGSAGSMPGLQGPTMSGSLRVGIARRRGRNGLRPKRRGQRCRLRFVRRGSPVTRRSAPQGTKSAPGQTAPSGSINAATRHTGLTRPRHGCEGRTTPVRTIHIPSARKPVQTTIKLTMIRARKLEEAISSRMTTPMPQSGKIH